MNAYKELLTQRVVIKEDFDKAISCIDKNDYEIEIEERRQAKIVKTTPKIHKALEWVDTIAFGVVSYSYWQTQENTKTVILPSKRTKEDEIRFLETLKEINYDNGYGIQELFGTIVFKDGTWLDRGEYDGSEWWQSHKLPREEEIMEQYNN